MTSREHSLLRGIWDLLRTPLPPGYDGYLAIGWWILVLFAIQVVTGSMLSFYYEASPDMAAESVRYIMRDVGAGWLVRGLHVWCTHGMIALGLVQMLRVLLRGTYRGVGTANWVLGCALLFAIVLFGFSGELLPWDDAAHGLAVKAFAKIESLPVIGETLTTVLRGGAEVASATLTRAHTVHVLLLPWASFFLVILNLWFLTMRWRGKKGA